MHMSARARPLVSVVTPSLNQGRFLPDALASVAAQDYEPIEHIVVDGGSSDETLAILRQQPSLRWTSEPDAGQSDALNKGIFRAHGEIVGWLNADDFYLPGAVRQAVAALARDPTCGMVYANYVDVDEHGIEIRRNRATPFDLDAQIRGRNIVPQPTAFIRRSVLERVGPVDTRYRYVMDLDLWIRVGRETRVCWSDEYWAAFRLHAESKSNAEIARFWREQTLLGLRNGRIVVDPLFDHVFRRYPRTGRALFAVRHAARRVRHTRR